jgi:hypothetical protein
MGSTLGPSLVLLTNLNSFPPPSWKFSAKNKKPAINAIQKGDWQPILHILFNSIYNLI